MSPLADPQAFARRWTAAWNARDLDGLLVLFADDVKFTSQLAARLVPESGGVVRGKDALRRYWQIALENLPELTFELTGLYAGIDTLLILFRVNGSERCEVLRFGGELVVEGHGTHPLPLSEETAT